MDQILETEAAERPSSTNTMSTPKRSPERASSSHVTTPKPRAKAVSRPRRTEQPSDYMAGYKAGYEAAERRLLQAIREARACLAGAQAALETTDTKNSS